MNLKDYIDIIEDFPTEGISFKDITKLAANNEAFDYTIEELKKELEKEEIEYIIGPEARGFLFGSAVAYAMGVGFIPVRKEGKLPGEVISYTYKKEYGEDRLEIKKNAFKEGAKVAIVDDLRNRWDSKSCNRPFKKHGGRRKSPSLCHRTYRTWGPWIK